MPEQEQNAFILRIAPSGVDRLQLARDSNQAIIGWSHSGRLLNAELTDAEFRELLRQEYYSNERTQHKLGQAVGHLRRFLREMSYNDLLVVPVDYGFHIARVTGEPTWDETKVVEDTAFRRTVEWLTDEAIPRDAASAALQQRMKTRGTTATAGEFADELLSLLRMRANGNTPTFESDLRAQLTEVALDRLRHGLMNDWNLEILLRDLMIQQGARVEPIVPRRSDVGVDIIASFPIAGLLRTTVGVQVKHHGPNPPLGPEIVDQLAGGMELTGGIDRGIVATTGIVSDKARERADELLDTKGLVIEFLEGEQIAALLIERGVPLPD